MKELQEILATHAFFSDLAPAYLELIAGCGSNVVFEAEQYLFKEGDEANSFYLIRHGQAALEFHDPRRGQMRLYTLGENDVLGWSWLFPPYQWHLSARAVTLLRATALDGRCLRTKCEEDHDLGYELMRRFAVTAIERLHATRMQVIDVYS